MDLGFFNQIKRHSSIRITVPRKYVSFFEIIPGSPNISNGSMYYLYHLNINKKHNMVTNKVVYVTGASKGIGKGIAAYLVDQGYRVAISSRKLDAARQATESLGNADRVLPLQSDVRNFEDEQRAVAAILEKWGRLYVLVANSGVGRYAPVPAVTHGQWKTMLVTKITDMFNSTKAAVEDLIKTNVYIRTIASLARA